MTQTGSAPPEAAIDDRDSGEAERSVLSTAPVAQAGLGLVAAGFGVAALIDAHGLDVFGDKGIPGPGFFPISLSVAVIVLGLLQVAVSVARGVRHGLGPSGQLRGLSGELLRVAHVWSTFLICLLLMPLVGFVPAAMLLIAYLVFAVERTRGLKAVLVIVAVPLVAYALFVFVLGVDLPESTLLEGL
jgi:hypothetical protein